MAGLPGSGKSAIAAALATALPGIILDKDPIRAALFPASELDYSTHQDDFCLSVMLQVAAYMLSKDPRKHVILDGRPFTRRYQREDVVRFAETHQIPLRMIECICSDETARHRLDRDVLESRHVARNRDYDLYLRLKAGFEQMDEPRLTISTDLPFEDCVARCLAYLEQGK
jgi:adenylylsulfate kinase